MRLLLSFVSRYPRRTAVTVAALLVAGLFEGFSLATLLPMLSGLAPEASDTTLAVISRFVTSAFDLIGLEPKPAVGIQTSQYNQNREGGYAFVSEFLPKQEQKSQNIDEPQTKRESGYTGYIGKLAECVLMRERMAEKR